MHQGVRPIGKGAVLSIHGYVSIYRRPVLHPNLTNQMRIPLAGQRRHWALDGVLKPLQEYQLQNRLNQGKFGKFDEHIARRRQTIGAASSYHWSA
jgi:hypothetical protein